MTHPFPHRYEATLVWEEGTRAALSSGSRPVLVGGPPPEFDGEPTAWSPEHLLLSSANLCFMTTYFALVKKSGLEIGRYRSRAEGILEKTKEGIAFTRIALQVSILAPAARLDEARKLVETAKKHCIVSNFLKKPVEVEVAMAPMAQTVQSA